MNEKSYKELLALEAFSSIADRISCPRPTLMRRFLLFLLLPSWTILIAKSLFGNPMGSEKKGTAELEVVLAEP